MYYQHQPGYQQAGPAANPATAIIAAGLGLLVAVSLAVVNFDLFGSLDGASLGDLPMEVVIMVILRFIAAVVVLTGAVAVFIRRMAGAIIMAAGGLSGILAVLLWPVLVGSINPELGDFGAYLKEIFQFDSPQGTFSVLALMASPVVLILAIIPPTLRYLRGSAAAFPRQQSHPQAW